ncbi:MAG: hypothetical protein FWG09_08085 [Synergistaceae bacterium]|nr:hypothetical protein [Synergistaceae bacterium]
MDSFLLERLLGLFWVAVQQFCFACLKYTHDGIVGTLRTGRLLAFQFFAFALLVVFCFNTELVNDYLWNALLIDGVIFYAWTVRVTLAGVMILFDALLVLYFVRIVRLYRYGLAAARPTLPGDIAVCASVAALCCAYLYLSITSSLRLGFDMRQYNWIGRFFAQVCNFFYISLEIGGAFLAWSFLRRLLRDKKDESKITEGKGL